MQDDLAEWKHKLHCDILHPTDSDFHDLEKASVEGVRTSSFYIETAWLDILGTSRVMVGSWCDHTNPVIQHVYEYHTCEVGNNMLIPRFMNRINEYYRKLLRLECRLLLTDTCHFLNNQTQPHFLNQFSHDNPSCHYWNATYSEENKNQPYSNLALKDEINERWERCAGGRRS